MADKRIEEFAKTLVDYSVFVKKGETVVISANTVAQELVKEVYKRVIDRGAYPIIRLGIPGLSYYYYTHATEDQLKHFPKDFDFTVKNADKYIGIKCPENTRELTNTDPTKLSIHNKTWNPITDYIVNQKDKIRRCTTSFPTSALAQEAEMSLDEYEDFFYNAVLQDWKKVRQEMQKIEALFKGANKVQIIGENTDITMSIKDRPMVADYGEENMPGGEIFAAPLEKTVNGKINFTYPAIRDGREVENVILEFKDGKVVRATADKNQDFLKKMIATDAGSQYVGELGIGCNYKIDRYTKDLLFDEKIGGTVHLALGMAYKECKGTNKSALHWDIVKDLRKQGEIIVDGKTIQKNGKWRI